MNAPINTSFRQYRLNRSCDKVWGVGGGTSLLCLRNPFSDCGRPEGQGPNNHYVKISSALLQISPAQFYSSTFQLSLPSLMSRVGFFLDKGSKQQT